MYKRKTVDCYAIEGFYEGYGWILSVIVMTGKMQRYS